MNDDDTPGVGPSTRNAVGCLAVVILLVLAIPACVCLLKYAVQCWRLIDPLG